MKCRATVRTSRKISAAAYVTSREWFRPNPPLASIKWGPRNNTNIQESALLVRATSGGREQGTVFENYWMKNSEPIDKRQRRCTLRLGYSRGQRRKAEAADFVNSLRRQGLEVHAASSGLSSREPGCGRRRFHRTRGSTLSTLADMYFSVQNYPPANPRPYDDTGWTMQYMRNVKLQRHRGQSHSRSADDAALRGCKGGGRPSLEQAEC